MTVHLYPRSLQRQLLLIILSVSALAIALAGAAYFVAEVIRSRAALQDEVESTTRLIGGRSNAALAFLDERSANENLASLEGIDHIASACLFTRDGRLLASFARASGGQPCALIVTDKPSYSELSASAVVVQQEVVTADLPVGTIQVRATTTPLLKRLASQIALFGLAMAGALFMAVLLAARLQRAVSQPLNRIRNLAHDIVAQGDYSLRARAEGPRELQDLGRAFNRVLATVQTLTEQLRSHQAHLEELVLERTTALEASLEQAKAANQAKSVFLSNMSHELRTPLNAVIGFSRLMARADGLSESQRGNLELINKAGNHLLALINEVLELSKIEAGRAGIVEVETDLEDLLDDVVAMLGPRAKQAGLSLRVELEHLPRVVVVDHAKLRQILINLLGNAVKFTLAGEVRLRVRGTRAAATDAGPAWRLDFAVSDTGIGIAEHAREHIFEPFSQVSSHATSAGTGLGLTISAQFLAMLGGHFTLESALGKGSTFSFALELREGSNTTAQLHARRAAPRPPDGSGRTILMVDDQPVARELLRQILEPLGFIVVLAADGADAVQQFCVHAPDLILMDWNMPTVDGLEATQAIRALAHGNATPIVMLTASAFEEQRQEALGAGATDFMRKPLDEAELFAVLAHHLHLPFLAPDTDPRAPAPPAASADNLETQLATLPADHAHLLQALDDAVRELNSSKIDQILLALEVHAPAAAVVIRTMVRDLRYQQLSALLARAAPRAEPG